MRVASTTMIARRTSSDLRLVEGAAREQLLELWVVGRNDLAASVDSDDSRRALEGAEHDHDAPVLAQVGNRFRSGADDVQVGDRARAEDAKRANRALGRDVHVAVADNGADPVKNSACRSIHARR